MNFDKGSKPISRNKKIIIVEEHGLSGGAGSAILEWGVQNKVNLNKIICIGGPDKFLTSCGNQEEARKFIGLTAENIYKRFKNH